MYTISDLECLCHDTVYVVINFYHSELLRKYLKSAHSWLVRKFKSEPVGLFQKHLCLFSRTAFRNILLLFPLVKSVTQLYQAACKINWISDPATATFGVNFYLHVRWTDLRLAWPSEDLEITVGKGVLEKLKWQNPYQTGTFKSNVFENLWQKSTLRLFGNHD